MSLKELGALIYLMGPEEKRSWGLAAFGMCYLWVWLCAFSASLAGLLPPPSGSLLGTLVEIFTVRYLPIGNFVPPIPALVSLTLGLVLMWLQPGLASSGMKSAVSVTAFLMVGLGLAECFVLSMFLNTPPGQSSWCWWWWL